MNTNQPKPDVLIVGAGVIGLGIAWRCRQRGLTVTVLDPAPGSGASTTAAGMLGPVTELNYGELPLLRLGIESAHRYPGFAAELHEATGLDIGLRECGTIVAAWDTADLNGLRDLHGLYTSLGLTAELISGRDLRRLEPALAPGLPGGLFAAGDHQVDNRLLHAALVAVAGDAVTAGRVAELTRSGDDVTGVVTGVRLDTGERVEAGKVVVAAGAWSARMAGVPDDVAVRPVKGQTLRLRVAGDSLAHVVRGNVKGSKVYLALRASGELVIGASSEEVGFDLRPRAGAIYELLRDAQSLVPALGEAEFMEVSTSLRPASPDNAPLIGQSSVEGLILATGHYRNGILLTPITADAIADLITTGAIPDVVAAIPADRFHQGKVSA